MRRWYKCTRCDGSGRVAFFRYDHDMYGCTSSSPAGVYVRHCEACEACKGTVKVLREMNEREFKEKWGFAPQVLQHWGTVRAIVSAGGWGRSRRNVVG